MIPGSGSQAESSADRRETHGTTTSRLAVGTVVFLGSVLVWSRLAPLDHSLWRDEIFTVVEFVRPGPGEMFFGEYTPNDHMLFTLLTWLTTSLVGESEVALRVWSAVPFIAGVAIGSAWLHRRWSTLAAVVYLFLATQSLLLLDLSTQGRGYGLAFLAMSVLVIAGCEILGSRSRLPLLAFGVAGVVGTWTLPVFVPAYAATAVALLSLPHVRRRLLPWLAVSAAAVVLWYLPVIDELGSSTGQQFGEQLAWHSVLTAPISQLLIHSLGPDDGSALGVVSASVVFGIPLVVGIWEAIGRSRSTALVLTAGTVGTYLSLTIARFYVEPRFVSWLLAPLLMLVALGVARLVRAVRRLRAPARVLVASAGVILLVWLGALFVTAASKVNRLPIEANREAAAVVEDLPRGSRVVVNLWRPSSLAFYLERPISVPPNDRLQEIVCRSPGPGGLIFVGNEWRTTPVNLGCLERAGAARRRVNQRLRGEWIDIWFRPASPGRS